MPDQFLVETATPVNDPAVEIALQALKANLDPATLQQYLDVGERAARRKSETEFNRALPKLQASLPTVVERGRSVNGSYATNEDIIETIRPKLREHGFAITHQIEFLDAGRVKVIGKLMHEAGYSITTEFISAPDTSGSKNSIQALGSVQSYGRRYTTCALLNIATRGEDDNGAAAAAAPEPEGYDAWLEAITAVADNGHDAFEEAWAKSAATFKNYITRSARNTFYGLKARAKSATTKKAK